MIRGGAPARPGPPALESRGTWNPYARRGPPPRAGGGPSTTWASTSLGQRRQVPGGRIAPGQAFAGAPRRSPLSRGSEGRAVSVSHKRQARRASNSPGDAVNIPLFGIDGGDGAYGHRGVEEGGQLWRDPSAGSQTLA